MMRSERRTFIWFVVSAFALLLSCLLGALYGATRVPLSDLLTSSDARLVILELRVPRVIFAVLVGGALACVGAVYQTIFRNPLASPFTLGVSSGAALGASLSLMASSAPLGVAASAMLGALVSITLIMTISRRLGEAAGDSLLLVGVVFSFLCSSVLTMLQYISDYSQLFRVTRWMMGGIPAVNLVDLGIGVVLVGVFLVYVMTRHRDFDLVLFGDDVAAVKGVALSPLYYTTFILSSLIVGWVVAQCGVIGFVGIVVPACARLVVGLRHRLVVPLAFMLGAVLVVLCDLLGRVVRPPFEVPAGVFTSIVGGPVFILLVVLGYRRFR
jgi:iron complex transport system permease protein